MTSPTLLWLRQDLRLDDQPALVAAVEDGPVIPVYVLDDETPGGWATGGAQRWWLHHSLAALGSALADTGSRLILRRGEAVATLHALMAETGATRIHALRHYEPWWRTAEAALEDVLCLHDGNQLVPVESMRTGSGGHFKVYSAFWRAFSARQPEKPSPPPTDVPAPEAWPKSDALADWHLLPTKPDWATGFDVWTPGEAAALKAAEAFVGAVGRYADTRDLPATEGTSRLSPHLHMGELSPRRLWAMLDGHPDAAKFRKELAWRDFGQGVILQLPRYGDTHGRDRFDAIKWRRSDKDLAAWQRGRTGYPIVDAGMRQMWATGWMHNRVRMITASFLVKHLLIDWRAGERWFWDCLIDADYANNSVNWQWIAGTGVDANMWGRIMAPLVQSVKFGAADYIRAWVPELAHLSDQVIHDPEGAGVRPEGYPPSIIGHREARERALAAGKAIR